MIDPLLTRAAVERATGFKKTKLYEMIAAGDFPAPLKDPDTGTVRWRESVVKAWIDAWEARAKSRAA
jgi:predicted DNA-binding transcriptional regulator AlpA